MFKRPLLGFYWTEFNETLMTNPVIIILCLYEIKKFLVNFLTKKLAAQWFQIALNHTFWWAKAKRRPALKRAISHFEDLFVLILKNMGRYGLSPTVRCPGGVKLFP
jgi:hypothetical protein